MLFTCSIRGATNISLSFLFQICEMHNCTEEIFSLAVNYLDRFLSVVPLTKNQLQLVGSVCLLLASKIREPTPIAAQVLTSYTDDIVKIDELPVCKI